MKISWSLSKILFDKMSKSVHTKTEHNDHSYSLRPNEQKEEVRTCLETKLKISKMMFANVPLKMLIFSVWLSSVFGSLQSDKAV